MVLSKEFVDNPNEDIDLDLTVIENEDGDSFGSHISWNALSVVCVMFLALVYLGSQTDTGRQIAKKTANTIDNTKNAIADTIEGNLDKSNPTNLTLKGVSVRLVRQAILGQESGYNYGAINDDSGALGFAQIMPFNLPSWSRQALGREVGVAEFMQSPNLQLKIIDHRIARYLKQVTRKESDKKIIIAKIASLWYSGNAELFDSTKKQYYRTKSGNLREYPSIANYCNKVVGNYLRIEQQENKRNERSSNDDSGNSGNTNNGDPSRGSGRWREIGGDSKA